FYRDLSTNHTFQVENGNAGASAPTITDATGGDVLVEFTSESSDLLAPAADPTPGIDDIYVRDVTTAKTTLESKTQVRGAGNAGGEAGAIDATGDVVSFESQSTNLDPAADTTFRQVFLKRLGGGPLAYVSRPDGLDAFGGGTGSALLRGEPSNVDQDPLSDQH